MHDFIPLGGSENRGNTETGPAPSLAKAVSGELIRTRHPEFFGDKKESTSAYIKACPGRKKAI